MPWPLRSMAFKSRPRPTALDRRVAAPRLLAMTGRNDFASKNRGAGRKAGTTPVGAFRRFGHNRAHASPRANAGASGRDDSANGARIY
jgi:hypothetical protein